MISVQLLVLLPLTLLLIKSIDSTKDKNNTKEGIIMYPLKFGGKIYYTEAFFKTNWYDAGEFCRMHGMNLLSIPYEQVWTTIIKSWFEHYRDLRPSTSKMRNKMSVWTSGNDLSQFGSWRWDSTGEGMVYNSNIWEPGEPNNKGGNQHCLELDSTRSFKLNDENCTAERYFICEKKG